MAKNVILVDDDADDRDLFLTFFSHRKDINISPSAGNGVELINMLNAMPSENLPDLIVLDQNMPKMNGKQTLKFLKAHERYRKIATVIYSTYADSVLIMESQNLGAAMVSSKPIDSTGYQTMMDDFLKKVES